MSHSAKPQVKRPGVVQHDRPYIGCTAEDRHNDECNKEMISCAFGHAPCKLRDQNYHKDKQRGYI